MKKTICKKLYDTDSAAIVKKSTFGEYGDPKGYEQTLYKTQDGSFFIYTNGGADSEFNKEDIKRISKQNAQKWILEH